MSISTILEHMNNHHENELKGLVKLYGGFDASKAILENVSPSGLSIKADGKEVFAPFPGQVEEKDYKNAIIALCMNAGKPQGAKTDNLKEEIESFKNEFSTILLSTLTKDKMPNISYSPILRYNGEYFIYISEVANHCENLRANPDFAQAMFIEDERDSKSILARKRLVYDISVEFMPRDDFFNKVYDEFEKSAGNRANGIEQIRQMSDFHLVKLIFKKGRYVKGFGGAFEIDSNGEVSHIGGKGMPHTMPHKKG